MKILIVGAGPRGLILAERLISNYTQASLTTHLTIDLIDPYGIGGRVWRRNQNPFFLMNSAIQQLTFFTDANTKMQGPVTNGPNFFEWTQNQAHKYLTQQPNDEHAAYYLNHLSDLKLNDYPSRGLLNYYANWYYEQLLIRSQKLGITLNFTQAMAEDINPTTNHQYEITTDSKLFVADQVMLALGHSENTPSPEEATLAQFARAHNRIYIGAQHPAEADLGLIPAKESVLIRGLGLNFFDYMIQLTVARGGKFIPGPNDTLSYQPSGNEPKIYAGSRSGLPLHAKGINQKNQGTRYQPHFLTSTKLAQLRENNTKYVPYDTFKHLFVSEMQYVYFTNLAKERNLNLPGFESALLASDDLNQTALTFGFTPADLFMLNKITHPFADLTTTTNFEAEMVRYLAADVNDAAKGNLDAPFTAAFDLIRDIRDTIRILIEDNGFSNDDRKRFLTEFNALSSLISVGPPRLRIQQLLALVAAGIIEILPAGIEVTPANNHFHVTTVNPNYTVDVNNLIEARLGAIDLHKSTNPIEVALRNRGLMTSASYLLSNGSVYATGAVVVNRENFTLIANDGQTVPGLRAYGVPLEKFMWFTTSLPRPYGNDRMLRDADTIARDMLALK